MVSRPAVLSVCLFSKSVVLCRISLHNVLPIFPFCFVTGDCDVLSGETKGAGGGGQYSGLHIPQCQVREKSHNLLLFLTRIPWCCVSETSHYSLM